MTISFLFAKDISVETLIIHGRYPLIIALPDNHNFPEEPLLNGAWSKDDVEHKKIMNAWFSSPLDDLVEQLGNEHGNTERNMTKMAMT